MRLGFHYHLPAQVRDGRIWTLALQGLFLDSLAPHFEKIVLFLHTPIESEQALMDYALESDNFELVSIGEHGSTPSRLLKGNNTAAQIAKHCKELDILLFRAPTPLLPLIVKKIAPLTRFAYLVIGEATEHINDLRQPFWRKALIKQYILWNEGRQKEYARHASIIFTNSAVVLEKYQLFNPRTSLVRTTTLSQKDFFERKDTCQKTPLQILYTGRIEEAKGLLTLAGAIVQLHQQGIKCKLNIVGWAEKDDRTLDRMRSIFENAGLEDQLIIHGKKRAGPELFAYYRQADVFVMPSQTSEGFPRTLWEAMAHSVPVITTSVGAIKHTLCDGIDALFIEPGDVEDTASKIKMTAQSPDLRKHLIQHAWKTAQDSTLEKQATKICEALNLVLADKPEKAGSL